MSCWTLCPTAGCGVAPLPVVPVPPVIDPREEALTVQQLRHVDRLRANLLTELQLERNGVAPGEVAALRAANARQLGALGRIQSLEAVDAATGPSFAPFGAASLYSPYAAASAYSPFTTASLYSPYGAASAYSPYGAASLYGAASVYPQY